MEPGTTVFRVEKAKKANILPSPEKKQKGLSSMGSEGLPATPATCRNGLGPLAPKASSGAVPDVLGANGGCRRHGSTGAFALRKGPVGNAGKRREERQRASRLRDPPIDARCNGET